MRFIPLKDEIPDWVSDEMKEYFKKADEYWENQQRDEDLTYIKLLSIDGDNTGLVLIRFTVDKKCHISRFYVDKKSTGLGSRMVKRLQKIFTEITLWSNPEAEQFYIRNQFTFDEEKVEVNENVAYKYGTWKKG